MKMISLEMDEEEKESCCGVAYVPPKYKYGFCLTLNNEMIEELGLKLPNNGEVFTMDALVLVTSVSDNPKADGSSEKCINLQITDFALNKKAKKPGENFYKQEE